MPPWFYINKIDNNSKKKKKKKNVYREIFTGSKY